MPSLTLDKIVELLNLPYPTLVSIDVEGHEEAVLKGMKKILSKKPKVIRCLVVEIWKSQARISKIDQLMADYGYMLSDYRWVADARLSCFTPIK